jgi:4-amino-4-deoxy-L-arabinose transferase-like glycosyltransferase
MHAAVFSFASGIVHPYYAVAMAPGIAALAGLGMTDLWRARRRAWARLALAGGVTATRATGFALLGRTPDFAPGLAPAALAASVAAAAALAAPPAWVGVRVRAAALAVGLVAILAGRAAYAIDTVATTHAGGDPAAGPAVASTGGRFARRPGAPGAASAAPGAPPAGAMPPGAAPPVGGGGALGAAGAADASLGRFLAAHRGGATWIAAVASSMQAAPLQLQTGEPVMALGGFNGGDATLTVDEFRALVKAGKVRYLVADGGGGAAAGPGGRGATQANVQWAATNCQTVTVTGSSATVYDCATGV